MLILMAILPISLPTTEADAATRIYLIDVSGSSSLQSDIFRKNMKLLNSEIDAMEKKEIIIVEAFRSHEIARIAFFQFPDRNGPKNVNLVRARKELRGLIQQGFETLDLEQMGDGTDCIGALLHSLLFIQDSTAYAPFKVRIYSDGLQTIGVGSLLELKNKNLTRQERMTKLENHLIRLQKKMSITGLESHAAPHLDELYWYGAVSGDELGLTAYEKGIFESRLRSIWLLFLTNEMHISELDYRSHY